jgi:hypothetical protein
MSILYETPWWVFTLFVLLIIIGFKSSRPRTISLKKLLILPGIFTILNVIWLAERLQGRYHLLFIWAIGLVIGSLIGWRLVLNWKTEANHRLHHLHIQGSWSTLFLILLVFAIRYFFVYNYENQVEESYNFHLADSFISGIITGIFIGRALEFYKKYCEEK